MKDSYRKEELEFSEYQKFTFEDFQELKFQIAKLKARCDRIKMERDVHRRVEKDLRADYDSLQKTMIHWRKKALEYEYKLDKIRREKGESVDKKLQSFNAEALLRGKGNR
jgi:uncharacterized coiled-coil DUF342 family protein